MNTQPDTTQKNSSVFFVLLCLTTAALAAALGVTLVTNSIHPKSSGTNTKHPHCSFSTDNLYAVQVSAKLVSKPCTCGFCDPSKGIAVPEHVNSIGHDLAYEISTNYLPVVYLDSPL